MAKVNVLLARAADSDGYTHLILADPVGQAGAGVMVTIDVPERIDAITGEKVTEVTLVLHGQRELDVPDDATAVHFPDGTDWKPSKK